MDKLEELMKHISIIKKGSYQVRKQIHVRDEDTCQLHLSYSQLVRLYSLERHTNNDTKI
jgi:hypothetical protein